MCASGMTDYLELGDVAIQRVVETEEPFLPVREFFPEVTDEMLAATRDWMAPHALDPVGVSRIRRSGSGFRCF